MSTSKAARLADLRAELAEVNAAIKKARKVQSFSAGGTSVTAGALAELRNEKKELEARISLLEGGRKTKFRIPVFEVI